MVEETKDPEQQPAEEPAKAEPEKAAAPEESPKDAPEESAEISGEESQDESSEEESSEEEAAPTKSKFDLLHEFIQITNDFLNQYDDMVENRVKHRTLYLKHLNPMREAIVHLLHQYILNQLPRDDFLYKHIKCCEEELLNNEEFAEHYDEVHKKDDQAVSLPEASTIDEYFKNVKSYIAYGRVVNKDLLFVLRRLLRKTNTILGQS